MIFLNRDYSASEFGALDAFNPATAFIDMMSQIGWAYDLKKASPEVVKNRQMKAGDSGYVHRTRFWELTTGLLVMFSPIWGYFLVKINTWFIPVVFILGWMLQ